MKMCLETSCIIGFLNGEPDCEPVGRLLTLAETGHVELFVSDFAWKETYKPLDKLGISRKERLRYVTEHLPKVARIGEWRIGLDVLGHDDSAGIERTLLQASRLDGEQFLSYAAFSLTFFATKDNGYLKKSVRSKLIKQ
jgi:hypothetical protein